MNMRNIVIVDDTEINVLVMEALVGKIDNCRPVPFSDPVVALDWCRANDPDLLVVDYMMPVLDGIEFIRQLRAAPGKEHLPMLMVTADHQKEVRYRALESGATDFLTKPLDSIEFVSRVRNMLMLRESHLVLSERNRTLAEEVRKATAELVERERETVLRLARAAEFRDPETGAHILRMAHYSRLIAEHLGMDLGFQDLLLQAAPMHDVGKLGTPDHILLKPGRLTPEEFEIMKKHASIGYEILKDSNSPMLQMAAQIAHSHHERWDGGGYPIGLAGDAIPIVGRIVAVADVFDALTSERPYKKAWSDEDALAHMREQRARHFDPGCLDAFLGAWDSVVEIKLRYRDDDDRLSHERAISAALAA
ncbi:MAG TPA: HD domain-containing protein [Rhodocyclaceae bacterium]|nr:HD domain-containing protein [Rhodocyclaceae bacterium]HMV52808.1 HD domain-containing protein [Rhodocyclaceae bacterium]HMZ82672.1 HD domain-containing protein [Rhodocyclaceae bacterium]HNA02889.1 HD domain-containing protein [Rhodocyclaceae bacterium]HNB77353.1 HD domain-containing protein [Rhodocyclaceae bacterium]